MMHVYFTVDTESSLAGAWDHSDRRPLEAARHVFCRIEGADFGVPLLTRLLKRFGFRGTFFVETLATRCLGEADTRSVFEFLLREGQDVQLHAHPVFRLYSEREQARRSGNSFPHSRPYDFLGHLDESRQLDLLGEATAYFKAFAGFRPTAFRAGCFAGSRRMMRCLRQVGVRVDSSFNPSYSDQMSFPGDALQPNAVVNLEGVWEIPVTVAKTTLPEGYNGFKFADCTSLSFAEIRNMLDSAEAAGQQHFVVVFHSFSAVKARDEMYSRMRPNHLVIRRLEKMFEYLAVHSRRFRIATMGDAAVHADAGQLALGAEAAVPQLPFTRAVVRKAIQMVNNVYWL